MAEKPTKKTVTKTSRKTSPARRKKTVVNEIRETVPVVKEVKKTKRSFFFKFFVVAIFGTLAFLIAQKYRGLFIAGMVNTRPISQLQLIRRLEERYGKVAFDEIVTEVLLKNEARKNGITVSAKEIADELAENEKNYGGKEALREMAKTAGITTDKQLNDFFELKIMVKKLQDKLFPEQVSDEEIQAYFDENKEMVYKDKKLDEVKEEVKSQLIQQKVSQRFSEWFGKLRQEAKITSFI